MYIKDPNKDYHGGCQSWELVEYDKHLELCRIFCELKS